MKQYHELLQAIKERGSYKEAAREGMPGTLSLFGYQNRYDLSDGFPIVTTKKMYWKGIVAELLWFLRGDTNIKYLDEHNVTKMWHEDAYNFYVANFKNRIIYGTEEQIKEEHARVPHTFEKFCEIIRQTPRAELMLQNFDVPGGRYTFGDCGYQYGRVWRAWPTGKSIVVGHNGSHNQWGFEIIDQIANVIKSIKSGPYGRRHLVTAIDPVHDKELALYWCHAMFQFNCRRMTREERQKWAEDRDISTEWGMFPIEVPQFWLDCQLYQRSCDVVLGVPFNLSSYALLTHVIAKVVGMAPGEFIHTFGDVHIYDNHKQAVEEQLGRDAEKYKLPHLLLKGDWSRIAETCDFTHLTVNDFILANYESYPKLEAETALSTGMKK